MAFDLQASGLALTDTYTLQLKSPVSDELLFDDEGKPVTIDIYGTASKQYRNATTAMQNRYLRRQMKKEVATSEQIQEESLGVIVACSATSTLEIDGELVDNKESFKKLYANPAYSWIRSQVDEAITDTSHFLPK